LGAKKPDAVPDTQKPVQGSHDPYVAHDAQKPEQGSQGQDKNDQNDMPTHIPF